MLGFSRDFPKVQRLKEFGPIWGSQQKLILHFNCKAVASISVLLIHSIVALPNDGRNYWLKHVVVNVMNKLIQNHL
jgi:hypothetical protein